MNKDLNRIPGIGQRGSIVRRALFVPFLLTVAATSCFGSAFSISELGARAAGMGTAFIAVADDGSALFYNPAGIAFQPGKHLEMDSAVVVGLFRFTPSSVPVGQVIPENGYSQAIKPKFIPIASLYATAQLSEKITLGFGMFTPFGLSANSTNFNDSDPALTKFPGRFNGTRVRLESFWFQPTVAYKINPNFAIAVGAAYVHTHLFLEQSILNPKGDALDFGRDAANTVFPGVPKEQAAAVIARLLPEVRSRVAGTANTVGFTAGLMYKNTAAKTTFGATWRSAVTNHLKGKASFAVPAGGYPLVDYIGSSFLFNAFPNQPTSGTFTTPATYGFGIANTSLPKMRVSFDFRLQDYNRFSSVPLNFGINEDNTKDVGLPAEKRLTFDFKNAYSYAFGVERSITENMTIRAGYHLDLSPVPDKSVGPLFPDSTRHSFTVGATQRIKDKDFTFFYEAMKFQNRTTDVAANANIYTNGLYHNFAHVAGLGLRFDMPKMPLMKKK
jgi:long-chain fatty acid transport protein